MVERKSNNKLSEQNKAIGEFLQKRRSILGFTQAQFAKAYDVDVDVYRTWEKGRTLPKCEQCFGFLWMLGNEGRERFNMHLGPILDMLRGDPGKTRARAFDALAIILEHASGDYQEHIVRQLEEWAVKYKK